MAVTKPASTLAVESERKKLVAEVCRASVFDVIFLVVSNSVFARFFHRI
jgi:hypothetical protein